MNDCCFTFYGFYEFSASLDNLEGLSKISCGIQFVAFDFATAKCLVEWEAPMLCVCNPKPAFITFYNLIFIFHML